MATLPAGDEHAKPTGAAPAAAESGDELERLRELLLGDERRELVAARARIAELERMQGKLSQRLPDAAIAALREQGDHPRVSAALAAPVAQALGTAVHNNRQSIIDALFPVIGPMIRRAVAEALRGLVDNLNGAIESSLSLRGLKWRLEAWRGGVPYAQVVLRHRLAYGIDHVFLIERASGLLLHHAAAAGLPALDADAIAGMLTALGDFVGDSVGSDDHALDAAQVGESLVWVEHGPLLNLACFMRGVPPAGLRSLLKQRLEDIHARLAAMPDGSMLADLPADPEVQERVDPASLLREAQIALAADPAAAPKRSSPWPLLFIALLVLGVLGWQGVQRWRWQQGIDDLRVSLAAQPGFVLGKIDARPWRSLVVHGLLDPDAPSLKALLDRAELGAATRRFETTGYVSTDDRIVELRARRLLQPPSDVTLRMHEGVLTLAGEAPADWSAAALARAPLIAGVRAVNSSLGAPIDPQIVARAALKQAIAELDALRVDFVREDEPVAGSDTVVDAMAAKLRGLDALAHDAGVTLHLQAVGTSDETGGGTTNARVRALRARWLALALAARGIGAVGEADAAANPEPNRRSASVQIATGPSP